MAAQTTTQTCCPGEARAAASAAACERELAEMALTDPTLSSCCARDLKEQRQAARLRSALAAADRTAARERERDRAVVVIGGAAMAAAAAAAAASQQQSDDDDFAEEDDNENDPHLIQLRDARMAELRRRAAERRSDASAGFGRLNEASAAASIDTCSSSGAALCVVHLAADGHEAGAQLDERLTVLARGLMPSAGVERRQRQPQRERGGVLFLRVPVGAAAAPSQAAVALCRELGLCGSAGTMGALPRGALPALVVLLSGGGGDGVAVEACAPLARFCAEGGRVLLEDRVDAFLRAAGVLKRSGGLAAGEDEDDEDEGDEGGADGQPCQLCGRTYPHEHVRAVYGRREDEGDDSDRD
jgi:hypothetical protein